MPKASRPRKYRHPPLTLPTPEQVGKYSAEWAMYAARIEEIATNAELLYKTTFKFADERNAHGIDSDESEHARTARADLPDQWISCDSDSDYDGDTGQECSECGKTARQGVRTWHRLVGTSVFMCENCKSLHGH